MAEALRAAFPGQQEKPLVAATRDFKKFGGDYQCNNAMSLFAKLKGKVSAASVQVEYHVARLPLVFIAECTSMCAPQLPSS